MTMFETVYGLATQAARPLLSAVGVASPKLAVAAAGRRTAGPSILAWGSAHRDAGRLLLWLHGASAGELTGAVPVVLRLRELEPRMQLLVTFSSPSAETVARDLEPDYAGYAPLDAPRDCRAALAGARPDAVVFAKLDVWPYLTRAAAEAGVPTALINATVRRGSSRLRRAARALLSPTYRRLELVAAASESDVPRLQRLGVRADTIRVVGDASFDRALERASVARRRLESGGGLLPPRKPGEVRIVAGSTWPEDEDALLSAVAGRSAAESPVELVLVPHEPGAERVGGLQRRCRRRLGVEPRLWSHMARSAGPVSRAPHVADRAAPAGGRATGAGARTADGARSPLIVDAVGVLAELYLECDIAYVGGGLGRSGLHSVVEPAAAGVPVLFGPRHDRFEADDLLACGGAREVDPGTLEREMGRLLVDLEFRRAVGRAAGAYVRSRRGVAAGAAGLIRDLMRGRNRPGNGPARGGASDPGRTRRGTR